MASLASERVGLAGQLLGRYRILERLGAGGMGEVYRARDQHLERDVAIKILSPGSLADEQARRRFRKEALVLSKLDHPNVASIYDFDTQQGIDMLVSEYIPGETLTERLAGGPLPESEILLLAAQLVEGLMAAHQKGIVHRDLKPSNLRIMADGHLKILDFGLAQSLAPEDANSATASTVDNPGIAGTLLFMAPEQLRSEPADARADLYSVGCVLYAMATGQDTFREKSSAALIDAILNKQVLPPGRLRPDLSPRLEEIILRCLEKNSQYRYQTAQDLLADLRRATAPARAEKSLAVLYFDNLSERKEQDEYFRDGITEDITTELSKIEELRVFSRSAVLAFRDKPVTPTHVGQRLDAAYVLEGSLRRDGQRLRITAKLVETRSGHTFWAERYDRQLEDVFAIQDEIAHSIARALRLVLSEREKQAIGKVPTGDVKAYDFYLRGRQFFHQFRRKGFDFARQMFAQAIEIDPRYARAYAGIADCCAFLYMYWDSTAQNLAQADAASQRALLLDPDLAEAHASRGLVASLKKDYEEARHEFDIALQLDPRLFEACYFCARSYFSQGELQKAAHWFEEASRVRPEDYQAPMLLATALSGLARKAEAEAAYRRGLVAAQKHLELHPGDARALYFGAIGLARLGDRERSLEWSARAQAMEPDEPQVLYNVACVYTLLGEADRAIDCLEKSATHGWVQREWMAHDPDLAPLHGHPRFEVLVRPAKS